MTKVIQSPVARVQADYFDAFGAQQLANRITNYWKAKGFPKIQAFIKKVEFIGATPEGVAHPNKTVIWVVRSNMVCGWPPR